MTSSPPALAATSRPPRWLLLLCGTVISYFACSLVFLTLCHFWPGPYIDYWIDIPKIEKYFNHTLTLHDLVNAHANVHRLLIPRLLFIADYQWFAGTNVLLVSVSLACKFATLAMFMRLLREVLPGLRLLLVTLVVIATFNAGNISNIIHNSNMQWDVMTLFSLLAVACYARALQPTTLAVWRWRGAACFWFVLAFFSQAGSLPVLLVFAFIALVQRRYGEALLQLAFTAVVFYLTFSVLPVQEPEKPTYEPAVAMLLFKSSALAAYVFKFLSAPLPHYLGTGGLLFSGWLLLLFIYGLINAWRYRHDSHHVFIYLALFLLLMMVIIGGARLDFSPNTWWATRYQITANLFMLCVTLHAALHCYHHQQGTQAIQVALMGLIISAGFAMQLLTHYYSWPTPFALSERVFDAEAYLLTQGINQHNGANLLPSLHEDVDRIAEPDPLFRSQGFAYYHNKQSGQEPFTTFRAPGELLLDPTHGDFVKRCTSLVATNSTHYNTEAKSYELSLALTLPVFQRLAAMLHRDTYYLLDEQGAVQGFGYVYLEPSFVLPTLGLHGYLKTADWRYIATIKHNQAQCLYTLLPAAGVSP